METMKNFMVETIGHDCLWIMLTYGLVVIAMGADLVTGIYKAKAAGRKCTSRGLKQTCGKAARYFLPMVCMTCIDLIGTLIMPAPVLTMTFGAFCVICELKSVLETTYEKEEIKRGAERAHELLAGSADIAEAIRKIIK